jgi:homogentisate 1,2-dioxygenase
VWKSPSVWIGLTEHNDSPGAEYQRHRLGEEVQYQVAGRRMLVSQHGCVDLAPGDFVKLPRGCAFTSVCQGRSRYISLLSALPLRRVADVSRQAQMRSADEVARLRPALATG